MVFDFLSLAKESKLLNPDIFSVIRFQLLFNLAEVDEAPYRDLKSALQLSDGALYTNLKALEKMGYVESRKIKIDNKDLEVYRITKSGKEDWILVKDWLKKVINNGL
ncbi:MAG TPA: transcriptional regulator [archaeon]|nr:transcriptional regulator [archaeon]